MELNALATYLQFGRTSRRPTRLEAFEIVAGAFLNEELAFSKCARSCT